MTDELKLSAGFDRELVWVGGGSYRYLLAEVEAPALARAAGDRPPLHLALVIDRSGSMSGHRLEAAKRAAVGVAERLRPEDLLSVTCFDEEVDVALEAQAMHAAGFELACRSIEAIQSRGMTNLTDGWLAGAECLAQGMTEEGGYQCRVIVLSDGKANRGIVAPNEIAGHAAELRRRGIVSSAVGIGDDYSPHQLEAIAEHGGGSLHDAEFADEIVDMVMGELDETLETFADELVVAIEAPPGVRLECWSGFEFVEHQGRWECSLGALPASRKRSVLVCAETPVGREGEALPFVVRARWRRPGEEDFEQTEPTSLALRYVGGPENSAQARDFELSLEVARIWQARLMRTASHLNREHDFEGVRALIDGALPHFERYCEGVPGAREFVRETRLLGRLSERAISARSSRDLNYVAYSRQKGTRDYKKRGRGDWGDDLRR